MKKVFSFGLLAVAMMLIAFSSCKPTNAVKKVTDVKLSETTKTITVGEEFTLTATVAPTDAADKSVMWTSDNSNVATVDGGKVTAVAAGTANITVTTKDGGKTATCAVTVSAPNGVTGVSVDPKEKLLSIGEELVIKAIITPEDATNKKVTWASDNEAVAKVDESGKVTSISEGTAKITVTTEDGGKTATCTVTVKNYPKGNAILLEDFTATWCGPCFVGMKNIHKQMEGFGDKVILVCHHLSDDFAIQHSRTLSDFYGVEGIPSSMIDRTKGVVKQEVIFHPGYLTKAILDKRLAQPKSVTISLTTSYDEGSKDIKIKVEGELLQSLPKAKLNVYLVQDGIVYKQAGGGDNYVHRNALRAVLSEGTWGDALGVSQGKYSKEYTYKLPDKIGKFATDPAKMYIVAFVADAVNTSGDNTKNIVHNSVIKAIK
ncbi:MAG: Ig-like domain-containing protein [Bacteroidota bacterium]|jgi:phage major tail protein, phi13 family